VEAWPAGVGFDAGVRLELGIAEVGDRQGADLASGQRHGALECDLCGDDALFGDLEVDEDVSGLWRSAGPAYHVPARGSTFEREAWAAHATLGASAMARTARHPVSLFQRMLQ